MRLQFSWSQHHAFIRLIKSWKKILAKKIGEKLLLVLGHRSDTESAKQCSPCSGASMPTRVMCFIICHVVSHSQYVSGVLRSCIIYYNQVSGEMTTTLHRETVASIDDFHIANGLGTCESHKINLPSRCQYQYPNNN